jgi:restriction system protein
MSVVCLNVFGYEKNKLIEQAKSLSLKEVGYRNAVQQFQEKAQAEFEAEFLAALRSGNVGLESGGYGLEKLIKELLVLEGYEASILGKNQGADISDIDIKATKNDWLGDQVLYVQAKHHKGHSDDHGIKQLKAIEDPNDQDHVVTKLFVTTGTLSDEAISLANEYDIRTLNGEELVKWLVERLDDLSADTKLLLGVVSVPQLHRYP